MRAPSARVNVQCTPQERGSCRERDRRPRRARPGELGLHARVSHRVRAPRAPRRAADRARRARRVPRGAGASHVRRRARRTAALHPRGARRHGRLGGRRLPRLRTDGGDRRRHRHLGARHVPGQRPDPGRRHARPEGTVARTDRRGGHPHGLRRHRARRRLRPRRTQDDRQARRRGRRGRRLPAQWRQAVDLQRRRRRRGHRARARPRRADLVRRRRRLARAHQGRSGEQARHPPQQHRGAVPRRRARARRPARGRGRGPGARAGPAGLRLHAPDGRRLRARRRMGSARSRHPVLHRAHPGRRPALQQAGLHAQADRSPRRAPGGRPRRDRGDRRAHRRRGGRAQHRGRDRQVPRQRGGQRRRRRRDPGARRLRLHA